MSLITCPECQQQISDKATVCPKCGYPLSEPTPVENVSVISPKSPTSVEYNPSKKRSNKKIVTGCIAVACVILILVLAFWAKKSSDERAAAEAQAAAEQAAIEARTQYINNLKSFSLTALSGAAEAESVCNLTKQVWYDTIYEEYNSDTIAYTRKNGKFNDDFNDSLRALYSSDEIIASIVRIEENQTYVDALYKSLQNPTDEFTTCFEIVDDLYGVYYKFTNLAISPTGSLTTYSQNFSSYDSDFMEYYNKLKLLIPEE